MFFVVMGLSGGLYWFVANGFGSCGYGMDVLVLLRMSVFFVAMGLRLAKPAHSCHCQPLAVIASPRRHCERK